MRACNLRVEDISSFLLVLAGSQLTMEGVHSHIISSYICCVFLQHYIWLAGIEKRRA